MWSARARRRDVVSALGIALVAVLAGTLLGHRLGGARPRLPSRVLLPASASPPEVAGVAPAPPRPAARSPSQEAERGALRIVAPANAVVVLDGAVGSSDGREAGGGAGTGAASPAAGGSPSQPPGPDDQASASNRSPSAEPARSEARDGGTTASLAGTTASAPVERAGTDTTTTSARPGGDATVASGAGEESAPRTSPRSDQTGGARDG
jgi:hypothetical protein